MGYTTIQHHYTDILIVWLFVCSRLPWTIWDSYSMEGSDWEYVDYVPSVRSLSNYFEYKWLQREGWVDPIEHNKYLWGNDIYLYDI